VASSHDIVLCELVWVLNRGYRFARGEIIDVLRKLTVASQLEFAPR
jgi:predicted nucleic-acid-binding protein